MMMKNNINTLLNQSLLQTSKILQVLVNKIFLLLAFSLIFSGCDFFTQGGSVDQWYKSEKSKVAINPNQVIIPVKPVNVVSFRQGAADPFDMRNLIKEEATEASSTKDAPDLDRPRQPLESYALSAMQFVGTIFQLEIKNHIALVNATGSIYQVHVGDYLGQDYGKVVDIRETEIILEERVRKGNNRWIKSERVITLVGLSKETLR